MDVLHSINSSISHGLVVELTVREERHHALFDSAFDWLTSGVRKYDLHGNLDELPDGLPVSERGFLRVQDVISRESQSSGWGYVHVSPEGNFDVLYNPYVEDALPWLKCQISDRPESASVKIGRFVEKGEVGDSDIRFSVAFHEELADYVMLNLDVDAAALIDPETTDAEHARLLAVVRWACNRYNVVFGHVAYQRGGAVTTELENQLRGPVSDPVENTPQWQTRLRGYSWLMVVPGEIAPLLGGVEGLCSTGAFSDVSILPNSALLLQATPTFQEYGGESVRRVYQVVRDVTVKGDFRSPSLMPGPPTHMVVFDE